MCAWAPAAEAVFGFEAAEVEGRHLRAVLPEPPELVAGMVEVRARCADGTSIVVELTIAADGDRGLRWSARDVTVERDPASLLQQLQALRDLTSDAVISVDREGRVIDLNPAAERRLGCTRAQAVGLLAAELALTHQDGTIKLPLESGDGAIVGSALVIRRPGGDRAERDSAVIERASRAFSQSLELAHTVQCAASVFVPELAEACLVYSFEPQQRLRLRSVAAHRPEVLEAAERMLGSERSMGAAAGRSFADGHVPAIQGRIGAEAARKLAVTAAEAAFAELMGSLSRATLPLRGRGGPWGIAVLLSRGEEGPTGHDLRLAQELAAHAGRSIENATLYESAVAARARFAAVFESAPSGMVLVRIDDDGLGTIVEANPAVCAITGRSREALIDSPISELYHVEDRAIARASVALLLSGELEAYAGERRFQRPDGQLVWVHVRAARLAGSAEPHVVVQVQDITDRKRYEGQLQFLADHDPLTGLFNRRRFAEELDWVIAYSRRYRAPAAVLAIDVDNFKYVNDTYGHATGDELLGMLGEAIRSRCRETDIAGRLGGDEFGVILPQCSREEAATVARALLEGIREHVRVTAGERTVRATASIGVRLVSPDTSLTAEEILSEADIALYDAKEGGRDRLSITADGGAVTDRLRARLGWSERIREALGANGFELYEQPILGIASGRVESSELLVRMRGSDGTIIAPGEFLDAAERFGQIQAIDCWVISHAIGLLAARQAAGIDLELEVNLSGGSVTDETVIDFIASEVRNAPIDPTRLTFEVTETAAIVNIERARLLAQSLADLGCHFALDDFGSGFGSFYYLKHLPFDIVKIDGEFVKDLSASRADQLTVQAIVQIARGLGKRTVAEFVETDATLRLLERLGVDLAQGYHIGRPRPARVDPGFGSLP